MGTAGGVLAGVIPTHYNPDDPITLFIIQVVLIIFFTRSLNLLLSRFRQPRVISEVVGGIILGPTVMGRIPNFMDSIFPGPSLPMLNLLATLGLVLFLFLIGVELNPSLILRNARKAITISASGLTLTFSLGIAIGYGLYNAFYTADDATPFTSFVLFIGTSMAVTVILARILSELKLLKTIVGTTAITASVNDDVVAWVLLALVVSIVNSTNSMNAFYIFLLCIGWILIVVFLVRPLLLYLIVETGSDDNGPTLTMTAFTLTFVLISAFVTNIIGVHSIFGGFIMGVIVPHEGGFAVGITEKIEDLVNVLFLPIYFALSGLKTQLGLLRDLETLGWTVLVICTAMFGKIIGVGLAARLNGLTWRESLTIGIFMSCKGAIVTTFLTTPLALFVYPENKRKLDHSVDEKGRHHTYHSESENTLQGKNGSKLLIVLNKVEYLPAMMTLVQLLQPIPTPPRVANNLNEKFGDGKSRPLLNTNINANTSLSNNNDLTNLSNASNISSEPLTIHALRLVELTQRISAVMKFNESEETILHDPIMNVFRMFGQLNYINIKANLSIVSINDFANEVAENSRRIGPEMVIIPWNGAGAIIEDTSIPSVDQIFLGPKEKHEKRETSPQIANYVQGVFNEVNTAVGFFVDRGLGVTVGTMPLQPGFQISIVLLFFGGNDDREALNFVVRLLDHPYVSAKVVRISHSTVLTENDNHSSTLPTSSTEGDDGLTTDSIYDPNNNEPSNSNNSNKLPERPQLAHKISTASVQVLKADIDRETSNETDDSLLKRYFGTEDGALKSNPRIKYYSIKAFKPLRAAIKVAKESVSHKDLVIIGRGRRGALLTHRDEYLELLKDLGINHPHNSNRRKCLGAVADALLLSKIVSSVFVIQGKLEDDKDNASTYSSRHGDVNH
ncbi:2038_t:CDS:2 [Entrophospora sp. SA101]|nr:10849_t:CDS:2 [Entrophospora sp. SA101]CAJ0631700.1 2038_t:CDS:2 [Entrophospora sp. SA101]CAJ0833858.1 4284_t:CDS:2 [Entrophospora sp. SA101]CAJ0852756.1 9170_t:CDS:2 [Entrophospora sp. SA101]CAJ0879340.1 15104_t:CDS:2 [Entrophospora sp. SA101]